MIQDSRVHGILPAAGQAIRLRRLPKFLLPCDMQASTLIELHIENLSPLVDVIWLPVRPDLIPLVADLDLGAKVIPVALSTSTMTETVLKITEISSANNFLLGMPDTIFSGEIPYAKLHSDVFSQDLTLGLWKTQSEQIGKVGSVKLDSSQKVVESSDKNSSVNFGQHWGVMGFNRNFIEMLDPQMPHVGYGISPSIAANLRISSHLYSGSYFDCGTFSEYRRFLINEIGE
jgi:hypothetical protein